MQPIYIIAEIASAHEGDAELAKRLVRLAAGTGADAVKLQLFRRDALISRFHPKHGSFGEIELTAEAWRGVLAEAAGSGAELVVEVYDEESLALAEECGGVAAYKIPTSDLGNLPFLLRVAATGRRLYLGVGGATRGEIDAAVTALRGAGHGDLVLLHGIQSFPTRLEDSRLAEIPRLRADYGLAVGYADHVDAEEREWARLLPAMAVAAGATVIEKHLTDDRARKGRDHYSSLNPEEFASFVALMRQLPVAMGGGLAELGEAETSYRYLMKRQAVVRHELAAGDVVDAAAVAFKRTNRPGLTPAEMEACYGRTLNRAKEADEPLAAEDFA